MPELAGIGRDPYATHAIAQAVHDDQRRHVGVTPVAEVDAQRATAEEALAELGHGVEGG